MTQIDAQRLRTLATAFHDAIKQIDFSQTGLNLKYFPSECCHHACNLLGIFLHDNGVTGITTMSGYRPDDPAEKHLWLEVNGVVIDITASQFDGVDEKVIVTPSPDWHSALDGKPLPLRNGEDSDMIHFERKRAFYNDNHDGLYDRLAEIAQNAVC